ncbi:MAG: hypothetical protein ABIQ51_19920 [Mesorhizobium sp.]
MFWIEQMSARVGAASLPASLRAIRIVDQDRNAETARKLAALPGHPEVLTFPKDQVQIDRLGHDHAAALDRCRQLKYATTHIILLDSDCFPIAADWLDRVTLLLGDHQAIVARDPLKHGLSHPCFMVLPTAVLPELNFSEGLLEVGIDTGRLIGLQLSKLDYKVQWDEPARAFRGKRGHYYLDGALYHHGSASFASSPQRRLRSQVEPRIERFFQAKVGQGDFALTLADRAYLGLLKRLGRS